MKKHDFPLFRKLVAGCVLRVTGDHDPKPVTRSLQPVNMPKSLVVVESPAKSRTIKKYLGNDYRVLASIGHVKDLPKSKFGVDLENNYQPTYEIIRGKNKVLSDITTAAKSADNIFLALDPDREGEAIAWHVAEEIEAKLSKAKVKPNIYRVLFNEITKKAVNESIKKPQKLDRNLYDAQLARRILDRIVGYKISPMLWDKVKRGLSAGRVQSVAVRIICEREEEVVSFVKKEYWSIVAKLQGSVEPAFEAKLAKVEGKDPEISTEDEASKILEGTKNNNFTLQKVTKKERKRNPTPPFITSKLQQEAARKLGFTAKKTMMIAQKLYEGMEIGQEETTGLITYMRTDSTRVADSAVVEAREVIGSRFGKEYLPETPNVYKSKKGAQDAHEAIRPTSASYHPDDMKQFLSKDEYRLYDLIWKRFVASQMNPAIFDQTSFDIENNGYLFRATGSVMKFNGFIAVYTEGTDTTPEKDEEENPYLPDLKEGEILKLLGLEPHQHFTQPPPRFTEASLVKEMEELGIGRPSTYASIMSVIQDKEYVQKVEKQFHPTDLGKLVNKLLVDNFPGILNVRFTAMMENELDEVEEGKRDWVQALDDFYVPFKDTLAKAQVNMKNVKRQEILTEHICPKCKAPLVIKWGKNGEFLACSMYPDCRFTSEFKRTEGGKTELVKNEMSEERCEKCSAQLVVKRGRFGKFLACSKYPDCKFTKAISLGIKCPGCPDGEVVQKQSRRGKVFFGCSKYPNCKWASWNKPVAEKCPDCGSEFLVEKYSKKDGNYIGCPTKECKFRKELEKEK